MRECEEKCKPLRGECDSPGIPGEPGTCQIYPGGVVFHSPGVDRAASAPWVTNEGVDCYPGWRRSRVLTLGCGIQPLRGTKPYPTESNREPERLNVKGVLARYLI